MGEWAGDWLGVSTLSATVLSLAGLMLWWRSEAKRRSREEKITRRLRAMARQDRLEPLDKAS